MIRAEELRALSPEQYSSRKGKAAYIQALNTRMFYDIIRVKIFPATRTFAYLVSRYNRVVHSIEPLSLQIANTPK